MLVGHGSPTPLAMFIADGGSTADHSSNKLISGYADRALRDMLSSKGLSSNNFYYTGLIKEKIITHKANAEIWQINRQKLTEQYKEILQEEIKALNPFLLIPLGELSFQFLTKLTQIQKYRGSVLPAASYLQQGKKYKVLPLLGPIPYWNQDYKNYLISEIDFAKLPGLLNDGPIPDLGYNVWVCRHPPSLLDFLTRNYNEEKILYFDIETYGGVPTCISLCFGNGEAICVPFLDITINGRDRADMLRQVIAVLASPCPKVNQNIKYDWRRLNTHGIRVNNVIGDTLIAINCIYAEFPKNLGFQTSIYTPLPYFKDEGKQYDPNADTKDRLYLYNAKDALAVSIIYPQQLAELEHFGTKPVYEKVIQLFPIIKKMEETGIKIDNERRQSLVAKYTSLLRIEELKLKLMVGGYTVNPQSPKQVSELVYDNLGYKKVPGVNGTDEKSLELLMAYGDPKKAGDRLCKDILQSILDYRKLCKVLEFLNMPIHPDGRFRGDVNLAGTENGRTSGGKTSDTLLTFTEKGTINEEYIGHSNQTIGKHGFEIDGTHLGKDLRSMLVVDAGWRFVSFDLASAEARVDTILAADYDILSVFDNGTGIHRLTGSWVYNCLPAEIKKNILVDGEERYHVAKQVRHAGERNMREHMLMILTRLPIERCTEILSKFHRNQPNIRAVFHKEIKEHVIRDRRLIAPNGRHRIFMGRMGKDLENEAISFLPQAIVGDQTKFALLPIMDRFNNTAIPLVEAHDGVLFMVRKESYEEFISVSKPMIETPIDFRQGSLVRDYQLTIPTEWETGEVWSEMEEYGI